MRSRRFFNSLLTSTDCLNEDFWLETLQVKPKPFYHDWFAASMHHALDFGGDLESAYAYYYSIRRIHHCMATCFNAQKIAA